MGRSDAHSVLPNLDLVCSADRTLASLGELALGLVPPPLLPRCGPARSPRSVSGTALRTGEPCASGFERGR